MYNDVIHTAIHVNKQNHADMASCDQKRAI